MAHRVQFVVISTNVQPTDSAVVDIITLIYIQYFHMQKSYDENDLRGCLDFFIKSQKEELDSNGQPLIDDDGLVGLVMNFIAAGLKMKTISKNFLIYSRPKISYLLTSCINTTTQASLEPCCSPTE